MAGAGDGAAGSPGAGSVSVRRFPLETVLGTLAGGLLCAAGLAAVLVCSPPPGGRLAVDRLTVDTTHLPPRLVCAGTGIDRRLQPLLLAGRTTATSRGVLPNIPFFRVAVDGPLAVASTRDRRLVVLAVDPGAPPRLLGSLALREGAWRSTAIAALVKVGDRVVAGIAPADGLVLIDLADPAAPRTLDHYVLSEQISDLVAVGGEVFAAGPLSGVWRVTFAGDRLKAVRLPGLERAWRLAGRGNRLAAANSRGELALYELDAVAGARLVGRERLPDEIGGVAFGQDTLYLCLADGTLHEYELSAWPRLIPRSRLQLPGRPLHLLRSDTVPLLLVGFGSLGVGVVDVARPGAPVLVDWVTTGEFVNDLAISADRLLIAGTSGLRSDPVDRLSGLELAVDYPLGRSRERLQLLRHRGAVLAHDSRRLVTLGRATAAPDRDLVAVAGEGGVRLYRAAAGRREFSLAGTVAVGFPPVAVLQRDDRLFVLGRNELLTFDCDREGSCRPLGTLGGFDSAGTFAWVDAETLLIADRNRALSLVNVGNPAEPRVVMERRLPSFLGGVGGIHDLLVCGRRVYVARGRFGVEVIDLDGPPGLPSIQRINTPGLALRLVMHDGLLLVADRGRGIQVIDTRLDECRLVGTLPAPSSLFALLVGDDALLTSIGSAAVTRLPLPVRLPRLQGTTGATGSVPLPPGLPPGGYRLVLYDETRLAGINFDWRKQPRVDRE